MSASTAYRATVDVAIVGEVRAVKREEEIAVDPPELLDVNITVRRLDISNDLLNAARAPIEDFINHEVRRNGERIHGEANKALRKAVGQYSAC